MPLPKSINQFSLGTTTVYWLSAESLATGELWEGSLPPEEQVIAATFGSAKRRLDFAKGRWLAHHVLKSSLPILRDHERSPVWPKDVSASLSHKDGHVLFVKADQSVLLGVDLESDKKSIEHLAPKLGTNAELELLASQSRGVNHSLATIFAIKESIFKAIYPKARVFFYFEDFEITSISFDSGTSTGILKKDLGEGFRMGTKIASHFCCLPAPYEHLICAVTSIKPS